MMRFVLFGVIGIFALETQAHAWGAKGPMDTGSPEFFVAVESQNALNSPDRSPDSLVNLWTYTQDEEPIAAPRWTFTSPPRWTF